MSCYMLDHALRILDYRPVICYIDEKTNPFWEYLQIKPLVLEDDQTWATKKSTIFFVRSNHLKKFPQKASRFVHFLGSPFHGLSLELLTLKELG